VTLIISILLSRLAADVYSLSPAAHKKKDRYCEVPQNIVLFFELVTLPTLLGGHVVQIPIPRSGETMNDPRFPGPGD